MKEKINKLKSILKDAFNSFRENILLINEMDNFSSTFDFYKYFRNINIIEHIRNNSEFLNKFFEDKIDKNKIKTK